jgi:hypothetical protein
MAHQLIASPYPDRHLVVSPDRERDQDQGEIERNRPIPWIQTMAATARA